MNWTLPWVPSVDLADILINTGMAFLLGLFISWVYRGTHRSVSFNYSLVLSMIILPMIVGIVMMVIGNNLARAFGLVGAMSIIRFRTAVKDVRDTAFVFFALAAGMAAGTGNLLVGAAGTLFIGMLIAILHLSRHGRPRQAEYILQFNVVAGEEARKPYLPIFDRYLRQSSLIHVKSVRLGEALQLSFYVALKEAREGQRFVSELSALEGINRVVLSYGEEAGEPL
ncbi:MAG: DUF4956 domain-containing protein [Candidatus Eisenbacteria bacterium]|nr:DUF4956 domain-containing protein [Candidatus Eisenbacteria bacterium]